MIFWNLVLWAVSFVITALLAPTPKVENARAQNLGDIDFPRAGEGFPVTKLYGRANIQAPNTLWYGAFRAVPITERVRTGLFRKKTVTTGYTYHIGIDLSLCLGPNVTLHRIIVDKETLWEGTATGETTITINQPEFFGGSKQGGGMSGDIEFYPGSFSQSHSAYLDAELGEAVPAYIGVCHLVFKDFYIGTSAQLRQIGFEASCYTNSLGLTLNKHLIGADANPIEILYDGLTSNFGAMSIPPSLIDIPSFRACAETLFAENNGASVVIDGSTSFKDFAVEILRQIDGIIYQDPQTGLVVARLIRNDYDLNTIPEFDELDIIEVTNISKSMWSETFNQIRLVYKSRLRDYEDTAAYAEDMANISFQGRPKPTNVNFPLCKNDSLANYLAFRELAKLSVPIFSMSMMINRKSTSLKPGDAFKFTYAKYGLVDTIMRVQRFNSGTLLDNRVKIEVYQDNFSVTSAVYAGEVTAGTTSPPTSPVAITECEMFILPAFITLQQEEVNLSYKTSYGGDDGGSIVTKTELIMALAIRPNTNTSTYEMTYSTSVSSQFFGQSITEIVAYPGNAQLNTSIGRWDGFVDGTMTITIKNCSKVPVTQTLDDARTGANLILIGDEFMMYTTVTNNMDGTYNLLVHRAVLDTHAQSHSVNDRLFFIADLDAMINNPFEVGVTAKSKPFGIFGNGRKLDDSAQGEFSIPVVRRRDLPVSPEYLQIDTVRTDTANLARNITYNLTWRIRNRAADRISILTDASEAANGSEIFEIYILSGVTQYGLISVSGSVASSAFTIPVGTPLGSATLNIVAKSSFDAVYARFVESVPITIIA